MQVFNSFPFTLPRLLVCWNLNSFKIYHDIVVGKCFLLTSINILFYIDYTVRVILRHLLCLYFVITKASLDILLVMLLDTISNDLIPYILFTNLCMVYIVFVFFVNVHPYLLMNIKVKVNSSFIGSSILI